MRRSEIFENFIKIAQEKGLVSKDAPEKAKKILEETRRADSQSIKDIEALYGVKPDLPKDMDYKKNIIEDAHPEPMVISPAHDKMNGLVENNNERQNIILNIVNKTPNGHLTQSKYAEKELILSLVRLGNDLDNQNKEELRVLADACLGQVGLKKKLIVKEALPVLAIVALVSAAIGSIYAHQHLPNVAVEFKRDNDRLVELIDDLLDSNANWGFGFEVSDKVRKDLLKLKKWLAWFESLYVSLYKNVTAVESLEASDLTDASKQSTIMKAQDAANKLELAVSKFKPLMDQIKTNFSKADYRFRESRMGKITELAEQAHLYGGATSLFADKFEAITNQIPTYIASIESTRKTLANAKAEGEMKGEAVKSFYESQQKEIPEPPATGEMPGEQSSETLSLNKEIGKMFGE